MWCSQIWAVVVGNQRFSIVSWTEKDANFPLSLLFFLPSAAIHCSSTFLLSSTSSLHPFPSVPDLQRWPGPGSEGRWVLWERLSGGWRVGHWRGESIMPHGGENTGAFLLARASADQARNTLFPVFRQLTIYRARLAQARRPLIACQCLCSSPEHSSACDRYGQSEKPSAWVADLADRGFTTNIYIAVDRKPSGFNVLKASHAKLCSGSVVSS